MISGAGQAPITITSMAQVRALRQPTLDTITLNSDLKNLALIINDKTGKYTDADKVNAYLKEYNGRISIQGIATSNQIAQDQKFQDEIKDSTTIAALTDGKSKLFQWERATVGTDASRAQFVTSLSDVQKQLPQLQPWNLGKVSSGESSGGEIQDLVTISTAAQNLFRGEGSTIQTQPLTGAQWDQLVENDIHSTPLSTGLQRLANVINDTSGKYSSSDKVSAYSQAYNGYTSLLTTQVDGVTYDQRIQFSKFQEVIANSEVGKAAAGGDLKLNAFESSHGGIAGDQRSEFYDGLSDLQKQLPQFKDLGISLGILTKANSIENISLILKNQDIALVEAKLLFQSDSVNKYSNDQKFRLTA